jgi:hypothetical protein
MKKIIWNKVTWYSKTIALVLFVALPFIGFYCGIQVGAALQAIHDLGVQTGTSTTSNYYENVAEWQTDSNNTSAGFTIAYPIDFPTADNYTPTPTTDWRVDGNGTSGIKSFTLTIPKVFEPQTNFADATLTVGESGNNAAVQNCLAADQTDGPVTATSTALINGISFVVYHSDGAGAGNYYETTSYRTLHAGQCYAVEYTIHSSQIANYPASYNLQPFNEGKLTDVLDRIVGTFRFQ